MSKYLDTPVLTDRMPRGIPFIIGNEVAERFSFYGMNAILYIFITRYLTGANGEVLNMSPEEGTSIVHSFKTAAYFFPIIGAVIADVFLGKYRTIVTLSLLYCVGHACLAMMDIAPMMGVSMEWWLYAGLICIAMGAGAIKPCVSAHVGDQFGSRNQHMLSRIFSWFYFSINVGAATSTILTPIFLEYVGPWLAFGVPGVLMAIATFVFWLGRHRFVHIPPAGWNKFKRETFSNEGIRAIRNLAPLFLIFIPMFWSLFDQTSSRWVEQAEHMNRTVSLGFIEFELLSSQIQAANPFLILVLIPIFTYLIYPAISKVFPLTPLRRIGIGMFLTAVPFALAAYLQARIDGGESPVIAWQVLGYVLITSAEVMVSITSLEFAYTQAPKKMKSFIMGIYFLGVALGNFFTTAVNEVIQRDDGSVMLEGADYYWFFTGAMVVTSIAFVIYSLFYSGGTYIQGEDADEAALQADLVEPGLAGPGGEHGQHSR